MFPPSLNARKLGRAVMSIFFLLVMATAPRALAVTPLFARGYTVLPMPQSVTFSGTDFLLTSGWKLNLTGVNADDVAVATLREDLASRYGIKLADATVPGTAPGEIQLVIAPGCAAIGASTDRDRAALSEQAYVLNLKPQGIKICANASPGLLYGVETLIQLIHFQDGGFRLPAADITDWPNLQLRVIYWDDAHHLEHMDVLKAAIRQAAFYKINGFSIKLEGHFQYKSAASIVEPYALSPAELQELTDFGRRYYVQVIPYLDGPAHDAFILKHPEYSALREYPESNYEFCATNPDTYKLFYGMFDDLLEANKGSKYFVLSTDEPYYVGLAKNAQCDEADRAKQLGSVGKLLAEFVTKTAAYLHDRGRTVIFWGEYPLKPEDIQALPPYVVNGEVYGPDFDPVFRAHGIRQMIYTSTQGEERWFPDYYLLPSSQRLHPQLENEGRVEGMVGQIDRSAIGALSPKFANYPKSPGAALMGAFVAGWADAGLHPETFWLGYATGSAAAWNHNPISAPELINTLCQLFYGPRVVNMGRVYQLMSEQAQFWDDSWETGPSSARTPIFGDSDRVFHPGRPALDQHLPPLPVPSPETLHLRSDWRLENRRRLELTGEYLAQNDQLLDLLHENIQRAEFNRYNLEVFLSVASLCRHNLQMLQDLAKIDEELKSAEAAAHTSDAIASVQALDRALDLAETIRLQRNRTLDEIASTWYQGWFPRVEEANGRRYLNQVDDVKDHQPVRTVDMTYLIYRELLYPLDDWAQRVTTVRNRYAADHKMPQRKGRLEWKVTQVPPTMP